MSVIDEATELAKQLLKWGPQIADLLEDLVELRKRQGRDAEIGDLQDSIAKLRALDRRRG